MSAGGASAATRLESGADGDASLFSRVWKWRVERRWYGAVLIITGAIALIPPLLALVLGLGSLAELVAVVPREQLADALPENIDSGRKDPKWIGVTIAKYGLMDLEYGLSGDNYDWATRTYTEDLRKILEIDDPIEHVDELLEILLEDIEETPITLRLYFSTDRCWRANLHYIQKGLPNNYWPLTFIVQDARITNSSLIWSNHHFYL